MPVQNDTLPPLLSRSALRDLLTQLNVPDDVISGLDLREAQELLERAAARFLDATVERARVLAAHRHPRAIAGTLQPDESVEIDLRDVQYALHTANAQVAGYSAADFAVPAAQQKRFIAQRKAMHAANAHIPQAPTAAQVQATAQQPQVGAAEAHAERQADFARDLLKVERDLRSHDPAL